MKGVLVWWMVGRIVLYVPVAGRGCANCFKPKAVMMDMMFVSCEKSK